MLLFEIIPCSIVILIEIIFVIKIISLLEIIVLCKEAIKTFVLLKDGSGFFIDKETQNHMFFIGTTSPFQ